MEEKKVYVLTYQPSKMREPEILDFKKYQLLGVEGKNHKRCNGTGRVGKELTKNNTIVCSCAKMIYLIGEEQLTELHKFHRGVIEVADVVESQAEVTKG